MIYLLWKFVIYSYVEVPEGRFFYGPGDSRRSKPRSPFVTTTSPFLITRLASLTRKDMQQGDRHDMKWLNNRHCHSNCEMLHSEMIQNNSTVTIINFKKDNSGFVWCSILDIFLEESYLQVAAIFYHYVEILLVNMIEHDLKHFSCEAMHHVLVVSCLFWSGHFDLTLNNWRDMESWISRQMSKFPVGQIDVIL